MALVNNFVNFFCEIFGLNIIDYQYIYYFIS